MHILFMGQHYWPEDVSGAFLATQLAESLVGRGHQVTYATAFPSYPKGVVFDGYRGKLFSREAHQGVNVIRTWSYTAPHEAIRRRFVNYATFTVSMFFAGLAAKPPDIIVSFSPPLPLGLTVLTLSKLRRVPWVLVVWDLFPEYAVKAGVIRNKRVISVLEWLERLFYRHAVHLSVISTGFRTKLIERGVPSDKLTVIPVWADPNEVKPLPKQTSFRQQYGWQDKFIVLYTGNLGLTCALEDALDTAEVLKDHFDIQFVIVGEGVKKNKLIQIANSKSLPNVTFLPFQPRERFPELLATADATLVTLNEDSQSTSLPSKTFSYLAASRPILVVAPLQSELSQIIASSNAGVCVSPSSPEELANAILRLKSNQTESEEMGKNGRHLLETQFSREHCVDLYENMLEKFTKSK